VNSGKSHTTETYTQLLKLVLAFFPDTTASIESAYFLKSTSLISPFICNKINADSIDAVVSGKNANKTSPEAPTKKGELKVHFIDVGQGDSILIQSHDGKNILVDGDQKNW